MQAIRIAYDILSNDLRRKQYDENGRGGWTDMGRRPKSGMHPYYFYIFSGCLVSISSGIIHSALPRASAAQWACQALHDDVFSRINLILMSDLRGLCEEASEAVEGADVLTVVTLSFLEAALGKKHSLQVRPIPCTFPLPDQPKPITHGCVMQCLWHTMACAGAAEVVSIAISHQLMASATTSGLPAEAIERY